MMHRVILLVFFTYSLGSIYAQRDFEVWTEVGAKAKVLQNTTLAAELASRFDAFGMTTVFPQVSVEQPIQKWLKASVDYRWVSKREDNGNFLDAHRINANLSFDYSVKKRLKFGTRLRYQFAFNSFSNTAYNPEFDQAFRIKPFVEYDIKNSIFSPSSSIEFFYSLENAAAGNQFSKIRFFIGTDIDLKDTHGLKIGYIFDNRIQTASPKQRNILSLSYTYKLDFRSNDKAAGGKNKTGREL
jgi:hypothetical protein